jgi:hypothetical protein
MRGSYLHGGAVARELEPQLPDARVSALRRRELPFSRGVAGESGEIPARTGIFQELTNDVARGIHEHAHTHFNMATNFALYVGRNIRNYFVKHGR